MSNTTFPLGDGCRAASAAQSSLIWHVAVVFENEGTVEREPGANLFLPGVRKDRYLYYGMSGRGCGGRVVDAQERDGSRSAAGRVQAVGLYVRKVLAFDRCLLIGRR